MNAIGLGLALGLVMAFLKIPLLGGGVLVLGTATPLNRTSFLAQSAGPDLTIMRVAGTPDDETYLKGESGGARARYFMVTYDPAT